MRIAVISDLHLGSGGRTDRFGHDDAEFLGFLDRLEREFERIVLLGDIWETLVSPRPLDHVRQLALARAAHPELARRFATAPYTYIHGNHDLVARHVDQAPDQLVLRADGVRILFTHGHLFDWIIRRARWISETGAWVGGWLLRLGLQPLFRAFDRADNQLGGVSRDPARCSFQGLAVQAAERRDADVVVTGHTHVGLRAEHGDRLFLNSGSCARGATSFLAIDTRRGDFGVHTSF